MIGTKTTFKFFQRGDEPVGWTESWYLDAPATADLILESVRADQLAHKRVDCCGSGTFLQQLVVSDLAFPRRRRVIGYDGGGLVSSVFTSAAQTSDFPSTAIECGKHDATRTAFGILFLRGQPDIEVDKDGTYDPGPNFIAAIQALEAQLVGSLWCFLAETTPKALRSVDVSAVVQGGDGRPVLTVVDPLAPVVNPFQALGLVGSNAKVNVSGVEGAAAINGQRIVRVIDKNTLKLSRRTPMFAYLTGGHVQVFSPSLYKIAAFSAKRAVKRSPGSPFFRLRGRSKARKVA